VINEIPLAGGVRGILVDGEVKVVLVSKGDYEGLIETVEIVSDKKLLTQIQQGLKEIRNGHFISHEDLIKKLKNEKV